MPRPPLLSFACPKPWESMSGTDQQKFCEQCGHHVTNLSLLNDAARDALLERAKTERICGAYWMRLSGEMVTPAAPLTPAERNRVKQFGVAALSASAFALAANCVASDQPASAQPPTPPPSISAAPTPTPPVKATTPKAEEEQSIVLFEGIICSKPRPPLKTHAPKKK